MEDVLQKNMDLKPKEIISKSKNTKSHPILYLLPHLIIFTIFFLIPLVFGIYIAITKWDLVRTPRFVGFDNFKTLLFSNSIFHDQLVSGLGHTFLFVLISVPFCILVPLILAVALNTKPSEKKK